MRVFIDTSAFYALLDSDDKNHHYIDPALAPFFQRRGGILASLIASVSR